VPLDWTRGTNEQLRLSQKIRGALAASDWA
jgi:hypothetical protein